MTQLRVPPMLEQFNCPDCTNGYAVPCAIGCRQWDECCDKRLGYPCERCGGSGFLIKAS